MSSGGINLSTGNNAGNGNDKGRGRGRGNGGPVPNRSPFFSTGALPLNVENPGDGGQSNRETKAKAWDEPRYFGTGDNLKALPKPARDAIQQKAYLQWVLDHLRSPEWRDTDRGTDIAKFKLHEQAGFLGEEKPAILVVGTCPQANGGMILGGPDDAWTSYAGDMGANSTVHISFELHTQQPVLKLRFVVGNKLVKNAKGEDVSEKEEAWIIIPFSCLAGADNQPFLRMLVGNGRLDAVDALPWPKDGVNDPQLAEFVTKQQEGAVWETSMILVDPNSNLGGNMESRPLLVGYNNNTGHLRRIFLHSQRWHGRVDVEEDAQIEDRFYSYEEEAMAYLLHGSTEVSILRRWAEKPEGYNFARFENYAHDLAELAYNYGDGWWWRLQLPKDKQLNKTKINFAKLRPMPWLVTKWEVQFDGTTYKTKAVEWNRCAEDAAIRSPNPVAGGFFYKLAIMREAQEQGSRLKMLEAITKDALQGQVMKIPDTKGEYVVGITRPDSTRDAMEAVIASQEIKAASTDLKPEVHTRIRLQLFSSATIKEGDVGVEFDGSVIQDHFAMNTYMVLKVHTTNYQDVEWLETINFNKRFAAQIHFIDDPTSSLREIAAMNAISRGFHDGHPSTGVDIRNLVLGSNMHTEQRLVPQPHPAVKEAYGGLQAKHGLEDDCLAAAMAGMAPETGLLLITGPPGVGKSQTLVGMADGKASVLKQKVSICAPTNAAAIAIASKIMKSTAKELRDDEWCFFNLDRRSKWANAFFDEDKKDGAEDDKSNSKESDEDESDMDESDEDESDKDESDKDKSDKDKSDKDKSDKDKSDKDDAGKADKPEAMDVDAGAEGAAAAQKSVRPGTYDLYAAQAIEAADIPLPGADKAEDDALTKSQDRDDSGDREAVLEFGTDDPVWKLVDNSDIKSLENHLFNFRFSREVADWARDAPTVEHAEAANALIEAQNVYLRLTDTTEGPDVAMTDDGPEVTVSQAKKDMIRARKECARLFFGKMKLVISTCSSSAHDLYRPFYQPTVVIIDEAGAASVPTTAVPLASFGRSIQQVILAGDSQQHRPRTLATRGNECGNLLSRSLFEMLLGPVQQQTGNFTKSLCPYSFLGVEYRMHEDMGEWLKHEFYPKLRFKRSGDNISDVQKTLKLAMRQALGSAWNGRWRVGVDVSGKLSNGMDIQSETVKGSTTSFNRGEAEQIAKFIEVLLNVQPEGAGHPELPRIKGEDIIVCSPYEGQVQELNRVLGIKGIKAVTLLNASKIQGWENKICLISLCKHDPNDHSVTGWIWRPNLLAVMLSRASDLLVIFGALAPWSIGWERNIWTNTPKAKFASLIGDMYRGNEDGKDRSRPQVSGDGISSAEWIMAWHAVSTNTPRPDPAKPRSLWQSIDLRWRSSGKVAKHRNFDDMGAANRAGAKQVKQSHFRGGSSAGANRGGGRGRSDRGRGRGDRGRGSGKGGAAA